MFNYKFNKENLEFNYQTIIKKKVDELDKEFNCIIGTKNFVGNLLFSLSELGKIQNMFLRLNEWIGNVNFYLISMQLIKTVEFILTQHKHISKVLSIV